jgi:hypothetical protein
MASNAFIPDTVLLLSEGESHERSSAKVGLGAREEIERTRTNLELNVADTADVGAERLRVAQVLART